MLGTEQACSTKRFAVRAERGVPGRSRRMATTSAGGTSEGNWLDCARRRSSPTLRCWYPTRHSAAPTVLLPLPCRPNRQMRGILGAAGKLKLRGANLRFRRVDVFRSRLKGWGKSREVLGYAAKVLQAVDKNIFSITQVFSGDCAIDRFAGHIGCGADAKRGLSEGKGGYPGVEARSICGQEA